MDERTSRERKAFLAEVEEGLERDDLETVLAVAGLRLKQMPGDLDARIALCRARIQQGRVEEAREGLHELEEWLADLGRMYASMGDLCLKKGWEEEAGIYYQKQRVFSLGGPASPADRGPDTEAVGNGQMAAAPLTADSGEGAAEEAAAVPDDFQTVTLAELYIRQGHLAQAEEVLEAILRKDPWQARAAEKLLEIRMQLKRGDGTGVQEAHGKEAVIAELTRWLERLEGRYR